MTTLNKTDKSVLVTNSTEFRTEFISTSFSNLDDDRVALYLQRFFLTPEGSNYEGLECLEVGAHLSVSKEHARAFALAILRSLDS